MEGTGTCTVCGADEVTLDGDEKCEDCSVDKKDDDAEEPPEGTMDEEGI